MLFELKNLRIGNREKLFDESSSIRDAMTVGEIQGGSTKLGSSRYRWRFLFLLGFSSRYGLHGSSLKSLNMTPIAGRKSCWKGSTESFG
jgi:hypothetical protein